MTEFSSGRNDLFQKFISYRKTCDIWNDNYESNLLYFDRYCTEYYPEQNGLTQEMLDELVANGGMVITGQGATITAVILK